jgi:CheY-like chemotaxis protein
MTDFSYSLLVVEDDANDREEWNRQIERHNNLVEDKGGPQIRLVTASSEDEANLTIQHQRFDAAIIDLKLDGNGEDPHNDGGNRVLKRILESEIAITAIFTGQPHDAVIPDYAQKQVRVITKGGGDGEGHQGALQWLLANQALVKCVRQVTQRFQREMASTFQRSIWPRWALWVEGEDPQNAQFLLTAVARHLASHVHDQFLLEGDETAHSEEWYWVPPRLDRINTGDIIRGGDGAIEVVVTPRCDLATGKLTSVQLVRCDDLSEDWEKLGKGKKKEILKNAKTNEHFIPKMSLNRDEVIGPLLVRFDKIRTVEKSEADPLLTNIGTRLAAISSPFLPSLVERLGNYYSRIGTPDYREILAADAGI